MALRLAPFFGINLLTRSLKTGTRRVLRIVMIMQIMRILRDHQFD
jgi:hypothetical protein